MKFDERGMSQNKRRGSEFEKCLIMIMKTGCHKAESYRKGHGKELVETFMFL